MDRDLDPDDLLLADALVRANASAAPAVSELLERARREQVPLRDLPPEAAGLDPQTFRSAVEEAARARSAAGGEPLTALRARLPLASGLNRHLPTVLRPAEPEAPQPAVEERYTDFVPVGEGGMGIVYWAHDRRLQRQVALKLVRPPGEPAADGTTPPAPFGVHAPPAGSAEDEAYQQMCARFQEEAWLTGGMEHPGVVPVYDMGRTEQGVPFYTMRYVRGARTLADALREAAGRGYEQRLALLEPFLKACDAVAYAHSRGVTHRDLKPGNLALGAYGDVVVLDWGLAKLKGAPDTGLSRWQHGVQEHRARASLDTASSAVGTPGYMAPEAARGDVDLVDERSDVWSLGAMLFEILTGSRPYAVKDLASYARSVNERDAPDARAFEPGAPAELADVASRALSRDPDARPAGPAALAAVVRAWQAGSAVDREVEALVAAAVVAVEAARDLAGQERLRALDRATAPAHRALELRPEHERASALLADAAGLREDGIRERVRRARRTLLVRAVAVGAAVLLLGGIWFAWGLETQRSRAESARTDAEEARRGAEAERTRAETMLNFVVGELHERLEPLGRLELLNRVAEQAAAYYEAVPPASRGADNGLRHASALRHLGSVRMGQGDLPGALAAFDDARAAASAAAADAEPSRAVRIDIATTAVEHARVLFLQGKASAAEAELLALTGELDALAKEDRKGALLSLRASAHGLLASVFITTGAWERSERHQARALALARDAALADPGDVRRGRESMRQRLALARVQMLRGDATGAGESARSALAEARLLFERAPYDAIAEAAVADAYLGLAQIQSLPDDPAKALDAFTKAAEHFEALSRRDPGNRQWVQGLVMAHLGRGDSLHAGGGQNTEARAAYAQAMGLLEDLLGADPTNATWRNLLVTLCDRGSRVVDEGPGGREQILRLRRRARDEAEALLRLDPTNPKWRHIHAYTLTTFASDVEPTDPAAADAARAAAFEHLAVLVPNNGRAVELVGLYAVLVGSWLPSLDGRGLHAEATEAAARVLAVCDDALAKDPQSVGVLHARHVAWQVRGQAARAIGGAAWAEAQPRLRAALEEARARAADPGASEKIREAWSSHAEGLGASLEALGLR